MHTITIHLGSASLGSEILESNIFVFYLYISTALHLLNGLLNK